MKNDTIIIGTRSSKLALWQADFVAEAIKGEHPELAVKEQRMTTKGDKILDAPLAKIGGKGLFTKELEEAMLAGEIDIAVHSLKDMPTEVPEGLAITAITKRADPGDAFVSNRFGKLSELPKGARVGTSSLRRRAQLLALRPDLDIHDLRGNVGTRLARLDAGEYDAIVLAVAGLTRLGFGERIREVIPRDHMLPAVGQGALAIESRVDDTAVNKAIAFLNDTDMRTAATVERAFLARVEGGCQVPVGVYAECENGEVNVEAIIASLDGRRCYRGKTHGKGSDAERLGKELAEHLLDEGGLAILQELGLLV